MKKNNNMIRRITLVCFVTAILLSGCKKQESSAPDRAVRESVSAAAISENGIKEKETSAEQSAETEETRQMFSFRDVYGQLYEVSLNEEALLHDYDMSYLRSEGDFKYYDAPGYTSRLGIDVSKFQGDIDWEKVKAQGIEFAFIRVGNRGYGQEGTLNADPKYRQNIEGAKAAGIDVGVYFYSQAVNEEEAVEEAEFLLGLIDGIELEYPVVFDEEYVIEAEARTDGITAEQFTKNALAFCEAVENAGYKPVIYATMKWEAYALELEKLNGYEKWYADYYEFPQTPYDFTYWQYTNEAVIDGISDPVDLNLEIIPIEDRVQEILDEMTTEEKVAQLFIVTPETLSGGSNVQGVGDGMKNAMELYPVGGIIYFAGNMSSYDQTKTMLEETAAAAKARMKISPFLAVDEEGGTVARVASNPAMGVENVGNMSEIGATGDVNRAYGAGNVIGNYLHDLGFNLDFAPDADVLTNPENTVVAKRSFGSDPELVSEMSLAYLEGLQDQQMLGVLKHFPGHGATKGDTHEGYAYTDKTYEQLTEEDLIPFANGVDADVPIIMVGHISTPNVTGNDLPASLSSQIIEGILREKLGYEGLVVTDALNMGAISSQYGSDKACIMALEAGADMLLMPADFSTAYEGVLSAVEEGRITEERLNESVKRILRVKLQYME
ncbi:MAG: glycoside hydrolase family 3 N-terminal domain-containing protein [Lachnospiraceae bacterium]